ncbi:MAG TPA: DUF3465 domain-containing protein [Steroidobacteraceae bacterium]|nr:DUF3465 domain-containing protein [Steroidobacteraceae bacterium]
MRRAGPGACVLLLLAGFGLYFRGGLPPADAAPDGGHSASQQIQVRRTGAQLTAVGTVIRILADDRNGSRHQRFIIRLDSGDTLLIAHNIDLAPRLAGLAVGERVRASGEFAWNPQGGTLHWTHHDPQGRHVPGYIEWRGRRYQ